MQPRVSGVCGILRDVGGLIRSASDISANSPSEDLRPYPAPHRPLRTRLSSRRLPQRLSRLHPLPRRLSWRAPLRPSARSTRRRCASAPPGAAGGWGGPPRHPFSGSISLNGVTHDSWLSKVSAMPSSRYSVHTITHGVYMPLVFDSTTVTIRLASSHRGSVRVLLGNTLVLVNQEDTARFAVLTSLSPESQPLSPISFALEWLATNMNIGNIRNRSPNGILH